MQRIQGPACNIGYQGISMHSMSPSPYDFYSTIDLRYGLMYWTRRVTIHSGVGFLGERIRVQSFKDGSTVIALFSFDGPSLEPWHLRGCQLVVSMTATSLEPWHLRGCQLVVSMTATYATGIQRSVQRFESSFSTGSCQIDMRRETCIANLYIRCTLCVHRFSLNKYPSKALILPKFHMYYAWPTLFQ
jgi:hypothetical protein